MTTAMPTRPAPDVPDLDDLAALRADTPGTAHVAHLNNAGSALPPRIVTDTMVAHLRREEQIGGYEANAEAWEDGRLPAAYGDLARLLHTTPERIAYVDSATTGWLRAFGAVDLVAGDRVLITRAEYASNVLPLLQRAQREGIVVETIPDGPDGTPDPTAVGGMVDDRLRLVCVTQVPSHVGLVADVTAIGRALRAAGSNAFYLVDGCQAFGQLDVDVEALGVDAWAATGRKFLRGPRGTGLLWVGDRLQGLEPRWLDLHGATWTGPTTYEAAPTARRFETWERSVAAVLGLGAAAAYALALGPAAVAARIGARAEAIRVALAAVPGVVVRDRGLPAARGGIVTFTHDAVPASRLVPALRAAGVNTSLSTADYAWPDFTADGLTEKVRVSPHVYTDDRDVERLLDVVTNAASRPI